MQISQDVVSKLNQVFGNAVPACDQIAFVKHIASILNEDAELPQEVDMTAAIQRAAVCALDSYKKLSAVALKSDANFQEFTHVIHGRLAA